MTAFRRHVEHLKDRPTAENIDRAWAIAQAEGEKAKGKSPLAYEWNKVLRALETVRDLYRTYATHDRVVAVLRAAPETWQTPGAVARQGDFGGRSAVSEVLVFLLEAGIVEKRFREQYRLREQYRAG